MHGSTTLPTTPTARAVALLAAATVLLAACGSSGGGDPAAKPLADEFGGGSRLAKVLGPATWEQSASATTPCVTPPPQKVYVTGLTVVAIDKFDETGAGAVGNFYIEDTADDPAPFSGITVFAPSFSPPDLRLAVGDVADILGNYDEFVGPVTSHFPQCRTLPELTGTMSFRFDGLHAPVPKTIPVSELTAYATARARLGMLVKLENVKLSSAGSGSKGRYTANITVSGGDVPTVTNELFDLAKLGPPLTAGATFKSVTGVITYFYGFHIAPRSAADFEL